MAKVRRKTAILDAWRFPVAADIFDTDPEIAERLEEWTTLRAEDGDWIILGRDGGLRVCPRLLFDGTYEEIPNLDPPPQTD